LVFELVQLLFDVLTLLHLQRQNVCSDLEYLLGGFIEQVVVVVDDLHRVFFIFVIQTLLVFLENHDHILDAGDDSFDGGVDILDITNDLHDTHQHVFIGNVLFIGRVVLDAVIGLADEVFQVLQTDLHLVFEEVSVHSDPLGHFQVQVSFQGL